MAVTIQQVIGTLMEPAGHLQKTVDTLKWGNPDAEVKGIAVAFMPTHLVIKQAIAMGANLLITHEGEFFSHHDQKDSLENNSVYIEKRRLIEESGIAIFRLHDYIHRYRPDGITAGLIQALGWSSFVEEHQPAATILAIPSMTGREIAGYIKEKLGISYVRAAGDLSITCTRIGLLAGYRGGGALAIPLFEKENLDMIIAGEGPEWETPEYVRDAVYQGKQKALIMIGHAESEESGMKALAEWIKTIYSDLPVSYVPEKPIFQVI
ncbi:Nif3-like dinuclear metal center hexameric protein [Neobacillus muris]|uniref:Nif3-like dinuclear metal center hexameric protein n=1 Tax=Neobacillus muris TaxID=2941334 RepID=UPI00203FDDAD|nr:Nif3-like dinuclear metal center hexameric protein [Neobacillus muris]